MKQYYKYYKQILAHQVYQTADVPVIQWEHFLLIHDFRLIQKCHQVTSMITLPALYF